MPEIGIPWIKAKLDTGAQTSAIHAFNIEPFERDGREWVRFHIHPWQRTNDDDVIVELPVKDHRRVRSSSGHVDERYVVEMPIVLVGQDVHIEVTLTNRDEMGFRMLIGRQALRHGFVVASDRSFVGGRAPRHTRRRNRGIAL